MDVLRWLYESHLTFGAQTVYWREIVGNAFGLASAIGGMRRRVWAWPVGIAGNALLLTVFLGSLIVPAETPFLLGQAGRQVLFIIVSVYGWYRWTRRPSATGAPIEPRWASTRERVLLVVGMVGGTLVLTPLFTALGSFPPVWSDAWIFMGSLLATYGMARGWVEFWLIWVAVDVVGVPLLFSAGYYVSGSMYVVYGLFTIAGFLVWRRRRIAQPEPVVTVG